MVRAGLALAAQRTTIRKIAEEIEVPESAIYNFSSMGTLGGERLGKLEDYLREKGYIGSTALPAEMHDFLANTRMADSPEPYKTAAEALFTDVADDLTNIAKTITNTSLPGARRPQFWPAQPIQKPCKFLDSHALLWFYTQIRRKEPYSG